MLPSSYTATILLIFCFPIFKHFGNSRLFRTYTDRTRHINTNACKYYSTNCFQCTTYMPCFPIFFNFIGDTVCNAI